MARHGDGIEFALPSVRSLDRPINLSSQMGNVMQSFAAWCRRLQARSQNVTHQIEQFFVRTGLARQGQQP